MSWTPWHEVQPGASGSPRFRALPCSEAACCFASLSWQVPHSTFAGVASCGSSLPARSAWQSTHCTLPWTDAAKAFSETWSETVRPLRSVVKPFSPWQARQSAFCWAFGGAAARNAASTAASRSPRPSAAVT